jgi:hypothetical protein
MSDMMEIIDVSEGVDSVYDSNIAFKKALSDRREEMIKFMKTVKVRQMSTQLFCHTSNVTFKVFVKISEEMPEILSQVK